MKTLCMLFASMFLVSAVSAKQYHVSVNGSDQNTGSAAKPYKTISRAAEMAQPGDVITVHEGTYRERVTPPRGGLSDTQRIVYQAAPGEKVVIKGSESIKGWTKLQNDTWKVTIPNTLFGDFNPYSDLIAGDWFNGRGRDHHTGAVYLNEHWLIEAVTLDEVLQPVGQAPSWYGVGGDPYLLNLAWLRPGQASGSDKSISAADFANQQGVQKAECSEGGECIGWIEPGDWVRYDGVDFGQAAENLEIRAASVTKGGIVEVRLDGPAGPLLGKCTVPHTGGWQTWKSFNAKIKPTTGIKTVCLVFKGLREVDTSDLRLWFAKVDDTNTTIWAQFKNINPNEANVEINARQSILYPAKPGVNYLTVRGFTMMHAATPWAPPTAEQIGLIGTHWSKGWIIENNDIRYSTCVGVTLGKHGDEYDNTSANTAEGYVKTIERGLARGWSKENIGHHIVRNNEISHCEQAGLVGSLGAVFCTISDNEIHDIHVRRLFTGAEMAGIKLHAAIDTVIARNHIYNTCLGIWLDWMAQGTRVTRNLLHDNPVSGDLFVEVDHGPFLVDNNVFLSGRSVLDVSQGGAYVHNLFAGRIQPHPELNRETPYHKPHSTEVAGLLNIVGGDDRFYNNIILGENGLSVYDKAARPIYAEDNVCLNGATPSALETNPATQAFDPRIGLTQESPSWILQMTLPPEWDTFETTPVTTKRLGTAAVSKAAYEAPDGTPIMIDTDYFGKKRDVVNPTPGPFANPGRGLVTLKVW